MPAGPAGTPGGVPGGFAGLGGLPECEVERVGLVLVDLDPGAGAFPQLFDGLSGEGAVAVEAVHVVVDAGVGGVGHAPVDELADDVDHRAHVLGCPGPEVGVGDVEAVHLGDEDLLETACQLGFGGPLFGGPGDDVVVDVGDVGHRCHVEPGPAQVADEDVEGERGAGVADVGGVVDGGTTPVHGGLPRIAGGELDLVAGQAVGEAQHPVRIRETSTRMGGSRAGG